MRNFSGKLAHEKEFDFKFGYCLPASCSNEKVMEYVRSFLMSADMEPFGIRCQTNDPKKFRTLDIFAM